MNTIDAKMGLTWLKEGFYLFRMRPFLLTNFFIAYFIFIIFISAFPHIGAILPPLLTPSFSILFLQAINHVKHEKPLQFSELVSVFDRSVTIRLLLLGGLYVIAAFIALYLSSWFDGGIFMRAMGGEKFDAQFLAESNFKTAFFVFAAANFISQLLFWFVTPLTAWKNMPLAQSFFYSIFTILRAWRPFIVYLLGLCLFGCLIPMLINTFISMALGQGISVFFSFAILMVLAVMVYCSFYSMYIYVFGKPSLNKRQNV